jgi:hypothetical protein
METQTIKVNFKKANQSFGEREKFINEEIQRQINSFRLVGLFTKDHEVTSKTGGAFSVKYTLIRR